MRKHFTYVCIYMTACDALHMYSMSIHPMQIYILVCVTSMHTQMCTFMTMTSDIYCHLIYLYSSIHKYRASVGLYIYLTSSMQFF